MSDIKQAAKWMQQGKQVHRKAWGMSPVKLHVCNSFAKVHDDLDREAVFTVVELIADDWEVAE